MKVMKSQYSTQLLVWEASTNKAGTVCTINTIIAKCIIMYPIMGRFGGCGVWQSEERCGTVTTQEQDILGLVRQSGSPQTHGYRRRQERGDVWRAAQVHEGSARTTVREEQDRVDPLSTGFPGGVLELSPEYEGGFVQLVLL